MIQFPLALLAGNLLVFIRTANAERSDAEIRERHSGRRIATAALRMIYSQQKFLHRGAVEHGRLYTRLFQHREAYAELIYALLLCLSIFHAIAVNLIHT